MSIVTDIRTSVKQFQQDVVFSYGRPLDNLLKSAKEEIINYLVVIDAPIEYSGSIINYSESAPITLSWLKIDNVDSESDSEMNEASIDSMEEIAEECKQKAILWLTMFGDDFKNKYTIDNWTGTEVFRVGHLMTGFIIRFTPAYKVSC